MIRARVSLAVASIMGLGAAVWFASSWLDRSDADITCGSVWRTDLWLHVNGCTGPMTVRLVVAAALACLALVGLLLAVFKPVRPLIVSAVIVTVAIVVLVVNESVRSGGSLVG